MNGEQSGHDTHASGPSRAHLIGTRGALVDGRVFYYAMNTTASSLLVGQLYVSASILTGHENITVNAAADLTRGAVSVTLTVTATVTANQFQEGFLCVTDGTGEGFSYRIRNHAPRTGSGTFAAELWDPIVVGAGAATTTTLIKNLWRDPALAPTTDPQVNLSVGLPSVTIAAGANIMWGDEPTFFGQLESNSNGYLRVRYSF